MVISLSIGAVQATTGVQLLLEVARHLLVQVILAALVLA